MTTRNLLESATLVEAPVEGPWKVRLISEGKGSSGIYPASLLENYGHAFNESLSFENHPIGWDGPETRNFTQIVGQVIGETWVDSDERGKMGVYANWEPDPDHRERLARYKNKLGLSIYIEGDGHVDEDGEFVVDSFNEHDPFKSVDVVLAAGRGGRFEESLKNMYSARRGESLEPGTDPSAQTRKENKMDEKAIEAINALTAQVTALVSANTTKAEENAQIEADTKAVETALETYSAAVEAIEAARESLLPSQVKNLMAEAKAGNDVTALIESHKEIAAEALEAAKESDGSEGRVLGEGAKTTQYGAWK